VYVHLARCFYGFFDPVEMKEQALTLLDFAELLGEADRGLKGMADTYCREIEKISQEDLDHIQFEYNRLFVGPARLVAPPYESVYRSEEHLVMGEITVDVRKIYENADIRMRSILREPEDHVATELEYLVELQSRCLEALENDIGSEIAKNVYLQRDFLDAHLLCWIPEFCREIRKGARLSYFGAISDVLDLFIAIDIDILNEIADRLDCPEDVQGIMAFNKT